MGRALRRQCRPAGLRYAKAAWEYASLACMIMERGGAYIPEAVNNRVNAGVTRGLDGMEVMTGCSVSSEIPSAFPSYSSANSGIGLQV